MLTRFRKAGLVLALLPWTAGLAAAQTPSPDLPASVVARVKAVVRQAQPRVSFAEAPGILIGQFHAANTLIHPHDAAGRSLPPYLELAPHRGGFYLELSVTNALKAAQPQTTPPTKERPWTTVTSFYPMPGGRTLVMTWEAAPGAPHGLALKVSQVLSDSVAR